MSKRILALYTLSIGLAAVMPRIAHSEDIPAWAMAFESQFEEAYNARDLDGLKSYYAEDAQVNNWKGMKAIREGIQREWEQDKLLCEDDLRALKIVNNFAIGDGTSSCWPKGGSPEEASISEWLTVWERQSSGQWRVILEQWVDEGQLGGCRPTQPPIEQRHSPDRGTAALVRFFGTGDPTYVLEVRRFEREGDRQKTMHLETLHWSFATPMDREDFQEVVVAIDEILNYVKLFSPQTWAAQSEVPQRCLQLSRLQQTEVLNNRQFLFETQGKHYYVNSLPHPCPGLRRNVTLMFRTSIDLICDVDVVTLVESFGWGLQPAASCGLGKFEPVDADEVKQLRDAARAG